MALHTYTPYEWKNAPDYKTTPLSADNLNHIEQGIKNAEDDIASVAADLTSISQTGSTASQAISAGTYFYLNGTLVRAKTAIANGATFTENTNYEATTVTATEIQDISATATIIRYGNVRVLILHGAPCVDGSTGKFVQVPEGDRPCRQTFNVTYLASGASHYTAHLMGNTDGNVYANYFVPATQSTGPASYGDIIYGTLIYIC